MHHPGHHHYHVIRLTELKRIYWAHTIKLLASSMTLIFIPIYLYRLDYSLTAILWYFLLFSLFWLIIQHPILKWSNRMGANRAMAISLVLQGIHTLMLATLTTYDWPLWLLALIWSIFVALYWPNFRACFAKSLLHKKVGPAVGASAALATLAYGAAPAIGGAVATVFGIGVLYVLATLLFIAAAAPLFAGKEIIHREAYNLKELDWRKVNRDLLANAGDTIDDLVLSTVWPLLIFLLIPSYLGVGILSSIGVIGGIVIALYVGNRQELKGPRTYLKRGAAIISLANGVRLLSQSAFQIASVNFINGLGHALVATPFNSRYYTNAEQEPLLPYVYAMMVASAIGSIILFGVLLILSFFAPIQIVLTFGLLIAIPAGFALRLIR